MPPFLSREWFDEVAAATDGGAPPGALVLEQVVNGTPYGQVTYLVLVADGRAVIRPAGDAGAGAGPAPDLTITCDWETAAAIAKGELSAQRALMQGRLRIRGSAAALAGRTADLAGIDPVPPEVRKNTTF